MVIALMMLAAPTAVEGPVLLPISPGHALSVLDAIALLPLLAGSSLSIAAYGNGADHCVTSQWMHPRAPVLSSSSAASVWVC